MKKSIIIIGILLTIFIGIVESKTITGTVTNIEGSLLPGVSVIIKGTTNGTVTNLDGKYVIENVNETDVLVFNYIGFIAEEVVVGTQNIINCMLLEDIQSLEEVVVIGYGTEAEFSPFPHMQTNQSGSLVHSLRSRKKESKKMVCATPAPQSFYVMDDDFNTEGYSAIQENGPKQVMDEPVSTFSIDVDAASYANMRRFINNGQKPPMDAIRIEEMINYFDYNYPQPNDEHPFSINYEIGDCPWDTDKQLVHVGLQGKDIAVEDLPASNLVFLIDVSGSMSSQNKLPLLKKAFHLLVNQLRSEDRVAIVVYAGSSGLVLKSTPGTDKHKILSSLERLQSGGSTAGAAGLKLAYQVAEENFIEEGNNRIILATDGDFNVGQSSNAEMERLIEKKRNNGIFISVLGFGMGNYKDDKMEIIADKGNGNYAYIDNIMEAKKVFINEFGGTLFTIAKDVKIQIEFNPAVVASYRLVGYENRLLNKEDFEDDTKDAGELGAGHTVTALYEIELTGMKKNQSNLKYQHSVINTETASKDKIATIKFRYKKPDGTKSILMEQIVKNEIIPFEKTSDNYQFSSAVAGFGMLLRHSAYVKELKYGTIIDIAKNAKGIDTEGYRSEFVRLVELSEMNDLASK